MYSKKYVDITNERIFYVDEGEGEVILLIHGNLSSSAHYTSLIEILSKKYRCIAVDMRGFGDSSYNAPFNTLTELASDIIELLDKLNITSYHAVGWSTGAGVAFELSVIDKSRIKSIFSLEGIPLRGYPPYRKEEYALPCPYEVFNSKDDMAKDSYRVAPTIKLFENKDSVGMTKLWNAALYTARKPDEKTNNFLISETLKQRCVVDTYWAIAVFNFTDKHNYYVEGNKLAYDLTLPITFTSGDKDKTIPRYAIVDSKDEIAHSKIIFYENCGHSPIVDVLEKLSTDIDKHIINANI